MPATETTGDKNGSPGLWATVIMPIRKCRSSVARSLDSLLMQKVPGPCEIIFVCDMENDDSLEVIRNHPLLKQWESREIFRPGRGMAQALNLGWRAARSNYIFNMHSDCYVIADSSMTRLRELMDREGAVAVAPLIDMPQNDWETMSFWDRVTSGRMRNAKPVHGMGGKFDLQRRDVLEKIGGYDEEHFFSAGEDADLVHHLLAAGKIAYSDVVVVHAHVHPPAARFSSALRKNTQLGEGTGALFRKYWRSPVFLRRAWPIIGLNLLKLTLVIGILIPPISLYAAVLMFLLTIVYARWAYLIRDWRVVLIPFAVTVMFAAFSIGMVRSFILGRQSFDYIKAK